MLHEVSLHDADAFMTQQARMREQIASVSELRVSEGVSAGVRGNAHAFADADLFCGFLCH